VQLGADLVGLVRTDGVALSATRLEERRALARVTYRGVSARASRRACARRTRRALTSREAHGVREELDEVEDGGGGERESRMVWPTSLASGHKSARGSRSTPSRRPANRNMRISAGPGITALPPPPFCERAL
jgi:hypothetical protein